MAMNAPFSLPDSTATRVRLRKGRVAASHSRRPRRSFEVSVALIGYLHALATNWPTVDASASDEDLMLRYAAGDAAAFDVLYGRYRVRLLRYLVRLTGQTAVAEELYQDTWGRVIDARTRYTSSARFAAWLFRIAHHLAIDHLRKLHPNG